MMKTAPWLITGIGILIACALPTQAALSWELALDSGVAWSGYNDVRIPNDGGDTISLSDDLQTEAIAYYRFFGRVTFKSRHEIGVLIAPLTFKPEGRLGRQIRYRGVVFEQGTKVNALYRFDSYRVGYRYRLINKPKVVAGAGLTLKVRDAEIRLENQETAATKTNTGLVPLIGFYVRYSVGQNITLIVDGDALAAPQGRAEDVFIGGEYALTPQVRIRGGYRLLEGGADNDELYTMALVHYAVLGVSVTL